MKKYTKQSVESDASTAEGALAMVNKEEGPRKPTGKKLATNDPKAIQGYTKLGAGGPAHTGKPTASDNRGEGY